MWKGRRLSGRSPARRIARAAAGIARDDVYVTNAVKHLNGNRAAEAVTRSRRLELRLPAPAEAELAVIARGRGLPGGYRAQRSSAAPFGLRPTGEILSSDWSPYTWHPSAICGLRRCDASVVEQEARRPPDRGDRRGIGPLDGRRHFGEAVVVVPRPRSMPPSLIANAGCSARSPNARYFQGRQFLLR